MPFACMRRMTRGLLFPESGSRRMETLGSRSLVIVGVWTREMGRLVRGKFE